jgi:hypothetical protein
MDLDYAPVPEICRSVGLSCKSCTEDSAKSLASVCKGLKGKAVTQLFYQIYPVSACSSMRSHFTRAYKEASKEQSAASEPVRVNSSTMIRSGIDATRREVGVFGARTIAALA